MAEMFLPSAFKRANPLLFPRAAIEQRIEALIALLDDADGDCDLEDADEDCCSANDDHLGFADRGADYGPGDLEDAEDELCGDFFVDAGLRAGPTTLQVIATHCE